MIIRNHAYSLVLTTKSSWQTRTYDRYRTDHEYIYNANCPFINYLTNFTVSSCSSWIMDMIYRFTLYLPITISRHWYSKRRKKRSNETQSTIPNEDLHLMWVSMAYAVLQFAEQAAGLVNTRTSIRYNSLRKCTELYLTLLAKNMLVASHRMSLQWHKRNLWAVHRQTGQYSLLSLYTVLF